MTGDFAHVESQFDYLVHNLGIDLFRIDLNIRTFNVNYYNHFEDFGTLRYYNAFYSLFKRLRQRYPDIIFENCAGGGARTDLGIMECFTHTWVSDYHTAPRGTQITNGMTMVLPPERVDRLASGMESHTAGTLDTNVRHTLFGRPTTNNYHSLGTKMNPNQIEFVRHSYDIFKNFIRPFAPSSKIYHHTPELHSIRPRGVAVLERAAADSSRGIICIFTLCGKNPEETIVYPRGIDRSVSYEVTFDNSGETVTVSGYSMANEGIRVSIGANLSSELILYKKI